MTTDAGRLVLEAENLYTTLTDMWRAEVKANGDTPRARKLQSARFSAFDRYARRIDTYERQQVPA